MAIQTHHPVSHHDSHLIVWLLLAALAIVILAYVVYASYDRVGSYNSQYDSRASNMISTGEIGNTTN